MVLFDASARQSSNKDTGFASILTAMPQLSSEDPSDPLRQAVEARHGGKATFVQAVAVHEEQNGQEAWNGVVSVFDLRSSSSGAFRAYAWFFEAEDGKRRFFSALHSPKVGSPRDAVRSAMAAEQK